MPIHLANENKLCQKNYISKGTGSQIPLQDTTSSKGCVSKAPRDQAKRPFSEDLWEQAGHAEGVGLAMLLSAEL